MARSGPPSRPDDGAVAVEFAFISVLVLFPLLFGIVQYGWLLFEQGAAHATVRDAARLASVGINDCGDFRNAVRTRASNNRLPTGGSWAVSAQTNDDNSTGRFERIADSVTVTITWSPTRFGFPLIPSAPASLTSRAVAGIEDVGAVTSCP